MQRITEEEARQLIAKGDAGYWELCLRDSISRSPIAHPRQICTCVFDKWYLLGTDEMLIESHGRVDLPVLGNGALHTLAIDSKHPLYPAIQAELKLQQAMRPPKHIKHS